MDIARMFLVNLVPDMILQGNPRMYQGSYSGMSQTNSLLRNRTVISESL